MKIYILHIREKNYFGEEDYLTVATFENEEVAQARLAAWVRRRLTEDDNLPGVPTTDAELIRSYFKDRARDIAWEITETTLNEL